MKSFKWMTALALGSLALGGCAYHGGSADYRGYEVRGEQSVRFGVIESVREVRIDPRETGVGTAGGAVLGGLAGSNVGGGNGQIAGAIGGAILGGIIGQNIGKSANQRRGLGGTGLRDPGKHLPTGAEGADPFPPADPAPLP